MPPRQNFCWKNIKMFSATFRLWFAWNLFSKILIGISTFSSWRNATAICPRVRIVFWDISWASFALSWVYSLLDTEKMSALTMSFSWVLMPARSALQRFSTAVSRSLSKAIMVAFGFFASFIFAATSSLLLVTVEKKSYYFGSKLGKMEQIKERCTREALLRRV